MMVNSWFMNRKYLIRISLHWHLCTIDIFVIQTPTCRSDNCFTLIYQLFSADCANIYYFIESGQDSLDFLGFPDPEFSECSLYGPISYILLRLLGSLWQRSSPITRILFSCRCMEASQPTRYCLMKTLCSGLSLPLTPASTNVRLSLRKEPLWRLSMVGHL